MDHVNGGGGGGCACCQEVHQIRKQIADLKEELARLQSDEMNLLRSRIVEIRKQMDLVVENYATEDGLDIPVSDDVSSMFRVMFSPIR